MLFQICIMTQVKNPQVEGDSCPSEGHCALLLGLASRKADLCQREFLQAGPFEEPAHFALSSAWSTVFTLPLVAGDGSGRYLTTRGSVGRAALSWRGRFQALPWPAVSRSPGSRACSVLCTLELFLEGHCHDCDLMS